MISFFLALSSIFQTKHNVVQQVNLRSTILMDIRHKNVQTFICIFLNTHTYLSLTHTHNLILSLLDGLQLCPPLVVISILCSFILI